MAWLSGYTKRKKITIDHTYIDSDLTDFPVLVKFTSDSTIGANIDSNGYNLRFTSSDGTTLLKYEREYFNLSGSSATGVIWVKIPNLQGSSNTEIYIYYKSDSPSDGADSTNVWDSNYKGVWHLSESSGNALDSTSNSHNLTDNNTVTSASGKLYNGRDFERDNSEYFSHVDHADFSPGDSNFEFSLWANLESKPSGQMRLIDKYGNVGKEYTLLWYSSGDRFEFAVSSDGSGDSGYVDANSFGAPSTSTWYLIRVWHDSVNNLIGISVNESANTTSYSAGIFNSTESFYVGRNISYLGVSQYYFDGILDEIHFSRILRSASWRKFEYYNQNESDNELSFGSEETNAVTVLADLNTITSSKLTETKLKSYSQNLQTITSAKFNENLNKSYVQVLQSLTSNKLDENFYKTYIQNLLGLTTTTVSPTFNKTIEQILQSVGIICLNQTQTKNYLQELCNFYSSTVNQNLNKVYDQSVLGLTLTVLDFDTINGQNLLVLTIGILNPTIIVAGQESPSEETEVIQYYNNIFQAIYARLKELN